MHQVVSEQTAGNLWTTVVLAGRKLKQNVQFFHGKVLFVALIFHNENWSAWYRAVWVFLMKQPTMAFWHDFFLSLCLIKTCSGTLGNAPTIV